MGASSDGMQLWQLIVSYGLEEEFERDWLGRIRSRRTKRYLRAEITPELAQSIAAASKHLGAAADGAKAALASGQEGVRNLLSNLQKPLSAD